MKVKIVLPLLMFSGCFVPLSMAETVPGPREPLSFCDSGIYVCPTDYLERTDTPFTFAVTPAATVVGKPATVAKWNERFKRIRQSGKRVIVDFCGHTVDENGKTKSIASGLEIDQVLKAVDEFFAQVDVNEVHAITLGEEQVFWGGQAERLNELYDKIKAKYDVPVYQWFSGSSKGSAPGDKWPNLKADGWMVDEYHLHWPCMERTMRHFTILQKPFAQICYAGGDKSSVPFIPERFWEQVDVCRKYNIPTGYFTHYGTGSPWGFVDDAPASLKRVFRTALQVAQRAKSQKFDSCDAVAWDFVPWEIPTLKLAFKSKDDLAPSYSEPYSNLPQKRGLRFVNEAEVKGFANLCWDSSPVQLRPRWAGKAESSIKYRFESPFKISKLTVTCSGAVTDGKEGVISVSICDEAGKVVKTASFSEKSRTLEVVVPGSKLSSQHFDVILGMNGTAKVAGEVLAGIDSFEVTANVFIPKRKVIELPSADVLGGVSYEEDLSCRRFYHTAKIVNGNAIKYSVSGLTGNVGAGKAIEIIQKFHAPKKIALSKLFVEGRGLETRYNSTIGIGLSLNGRDIKAKTMSKGNFNGVLEADLSELTAKFQADTFYVHLFLEGTAGLITSYGLNGNIVK